jgi:hypothetical protein
MSMTGYEDVEDAEELPPPYKRNWKLEEVSIGTAGDAVYANVQLDGEVIGSIRFPDREYLGWFRNRIVEGEE